MLFMEMTRRGVTICQCKHSNTLSLPIETCVSPKSKGMEKTCHILRMVLFNFQDYSLDLKRFHETKMYKTVCFMWKYTVHGFHCIEMSMPILNTRMLLKGILYTCATHTGCHPG